MTGGGRRISSRDNPLYREFTDPSGSARERRRLGRSVLEGIHLCEAYVQQHGAPLSSIVSESGATNPEVLSLLAQHALVPAIVADPLFASLSTLAQGIGIAFIVATPNPSLPETIELDAVYLDRLQDPGNVGTLLRTCSKTANSSSLSLARLPMSASSEPSLTRPSGFTAASRISRTSASML
jgi:TrmH family RNA methyltransferase